MKKLKRKLDQFIINFFKIIFFFLFINASIANEISIEVEGNKFTDDDVILSLLSDKPKNINENYSNYIIKTLDDSNLFDSVYVITSDNKYTIYIKEYANLKKISYRNNERIKKDELNYIANELKLTNLNENIINLFISEVKKLYESFGYNNVKIIYTKDIDVNTNTANLEFEFDEGTITKINKINFNGNVTFDNQTLSNVIESKTKSLRNIFANNNYKNYLIEKDKFTLLQFYKNNGFIDITIETKIEYLDTNKVNVFFYISEGEIYNFKNVNISDEANLIDVETINLINNEINKIITDNNTYSQEKINILKDNITSLVLNNGIDFFEIDVLQKIENKEVDLLFIFTEMKPLYTNQINIYGNTRTFDKVIRRELELIEGDALHPSQLEKIQNKLLSLKLFETVNVSQELIDDDTVNINITIKEKQTGSFNAGVSVGTIDGFSIVTGLKERNFYGTGRSLEALINTSQDRREFKFLTSDRLYQTDADLSYKLNYKQEDLSKASSYKLDTISSGVGIAYKINKKLLHNIDLEYSLKDYKITNSSTVASSIAKSSGTNVSFLLKNNLRYSSLNPGFILKNGTYLNFNNSIETPTSSSNGFVRNILTYKNFYTKNKNIFSIQTKIGNILSLNNNDILTDDKFSLGGRWLRGFDSFGVGPRNSRTSYVGGNNLVAAKLDYSIQFIENNNFPIFLNLFNDYGVLWGNKTKPTQNDQNLRSSVGFGIKYYSPIGPIGFTWGFPVMDEEYDIKRMFLFSVGNID